MILELYTILHDRQVYLKLIAGYSMRKSDEKFRDEQKKQCTCKIKMQNAKKFIIIYYYYYDCDSSIFIILLVCIIVKIHNLTTKYK